MAYFKLFEAAGFVIFETSRGFREVFQGNGQLQVTAGTAASNPIKTVTLTDSDTSTVVAQEVPISLIQDQSGTVIDNAGSTAVASLQAICDVKLLSDFVVKDETTALSGTTKIRHKEGSAGADRDEGGTLELDLHSASIGLYGSYLTITEEDLSNTSGKDGAYGRLQLFLENAGTPLEVLDMEMSSLVQAPAVDLNTSSLDVSGDVTFSSAAGTVTFSGDTSGIAYGDITGTPTIPTNVSDLTNDSGFITAANELDGVYLEVSTRTSAYGSGSFEGHVVKFGTGTLSAGKIYVLRDNSGTGLWDEADADAEIQTKGLLGIALGTSPTTNGLLVRGIRSLSNSFTVGAPLYISLTAGTMTDDLSSHTTGDFVRAVGYSLSTTLIYLDPSPDYIEVA